MPWNARKAEEITGYTVIERVSATPEFRFAAVDEQGMTVAEGFGRSEPEAIHRLVERVYRIHASAVALKQRNRCHECGRLKPLQAHHVKHRSKGRDDRMANIRMLCSDCHHLQHGGGV